MLLWLYGWGVLLIDLWEIGNPVSVFLCGGEHLVFVCVWYRICGDLVIFCWIMMPIGFIWSWEDILLSSSLNPWRLQGSKKTRMWCVSVHIEICQCSGSCLLNLFERLFWFLLLFAGVSTPFCKLLFAGWELAVQVWEGCFSCVLVKDQFHSNDTCY